jgi:subtilisin family serine protease
MKPFPKRLRHASGRWLTLDESTLLLVYQDDRARARVDVDLAGEGLTRIESPPVEHPRAPTKTPSKKARGRRGGDLPALPRLNESSTRFFVRRSDGKNLDAKLTSGIRRRFGGQLHCIAPVYRLEGATGNEGGIIPLPDVLLVGMKPGQSEAQEVATLEALRALGLEEDELKSACLVGFRYFRIRALEEDHAYSLMAGVKRVGGVADVRFENLPMVVPTALVPGDAFYASQWNMPQIDAEEAWNLSAGHPSVVVAVQDSGTDLTHPDLTLASNGVNLGTMAGTGAPTGGNAHGTACAGIIGAAVDNGQGVAGLAGGCSILPIAFSTWSDAEVAAGITYAASNGARVLSMSFGVYATGEALPDGWDFAIIDPAIEDAHSRGVVLVAATGNEDINTFNRYPSRHPLVIAVGASSTDDNRKTTTSPDGESWWGSNWANGVSVVAPGVLIPTSDIQGSAGYNPAAGAAGDYTMTFNGTSSATPHVAALAALCVSTNPFMSNEDVRFLIETNAEKVGSTAYSTVAGFANGTRNQAMGYGRINARDTVADSAMLFVEQYNLLFG